ncbi:MAG: NAD(P)H-dependent glycerol-3-phosphate dehydrogenase [Microcystaceae cyanobacterium]
MKNSEQLVTILGAGRWGTELANLVRRNHSPIYLWSRHSSDNLSEAIARSVFIIAAVSMKGVVPTIAQVKGTDLSSQTIIITATKGLDLATLKTPSQLWGEAFPDHPLVVLSGPNLSKEIEAGLPTATAVASVNSPAAENVQKLFSSEQFRVYLNSDPLGTELGGTLKNVMAIAAGVCDGLSLGINAKAALLTRALPEMIRVGIAFGANPETFLGLSGLGDLLATCSSPLSRNYQVGYKLGQGKNLTQILAESEGTAEGINTTEVLIEIAKAKNLSVPIAHQVNSLLKGEISPGIAVKNLMARELTSEATIF